MDEEYLDESICGISIIESDLNDFEKQCKHKKGVQLRLNRCQMINRYQIINIMINEHEDM